MTESATGLILRTRPFTETSLIVEWLTPQAGRIHTVAKGARRPKSPFRGKLDLFYLADFSYARSRRSELHTLSEVKLLDTHAALRRELGYLRQASYCAALIEQTTERDTPLPAIFEMLKELLATFPKHPPLPQTVFAFELKLLDELGLKPEVAKSRLTAGAGRIIEALSTCGWPAVAQLKLSTAQVNEVRRFLHGFLIFHLGRIPNGRNAVLGPAELPAQ